MADDSLTHTPVSPGRLLSWYSVVLCWYLFGMALLWGLGVEAIYGNPTPFHALYAWAFDSLAVPLGAISFAIILGAVYRSACLSPPLRMTRGILLALLVALCLAVVFCFMAYQRAEADYRTFGEGVRQLWKMLRWHCLLVLLVFGAWNVWTFMGKPLLAREEEPDSRKIMGFLAGLMVFWVLFAVGVAMLRGGMDAVAAPYRRETYEYINDIGLGGSIRGLFHQYTALHDHLSMHSKVHPPGPVVLLWLLSDIVMSRTPSALALATIVAGSVSVFPFYYWVRDLTSNRVALVASCLFTLVPSCVLFTAVSADILFMPMTLTTLFLFGRAVERSSPGYALAAGVGYAFLSLTSFSLIGMGAYFAFFGLWRLRERTKGVLQTAVLMLVAFLAVHVLVRWWSGFDIFTCFQQSRRQFIEDQMNLDLFTPRYPGWTFRFWNPLCWFYFAGIPVSLLFLSRLLHPEPGSRSLFLVFALTLFALNLLYVARGEGERSAMYIFPFVVLPAAHRLEEWVRTYHSVALLDVTLLFLLFQCWLTESFFYTYW